MAAVRAAARPAGVLASWEEAASKLIVALDVPGVDQAEQIVRDLDEAVKFFKLGPWLQFARGYERLLDNLLDKGKKVFADTKSFDIPETMRGLVAAAAKRGISFLTIHGNGEVTDDALRAAVDGRGDSDLRLFCVTVLTSMDQDDLFRRKGHNQPLEDEAVDRAKRAIRCGLDGVIASGREARLIKQQVSSEILVVTPGIRPEGATIDDHKRAVTPLDAITAGADYLVVGRPIVRADDPAAVASRIIREIQDALDRCPAVAA